MEIPKQIDFIALVIFLGVFLGLFVSYFIIKKSLGNNLPNLFMGLFILAISLTMLEGWLNYTGYIFRFLWLSNFAEPLNFLMAGLLYLFIDSQLDGHRKKYYWVHFIPSLFWFGICMFYFLQPDEVKFNDSLEVMDMDYPRLDENQTFSDDPLGVRNYTNLLTGIYFVVYIILGSRKLLLKTKSLGESIFVTKNKTLKAIRNISLHIIIVTIIFILVKNTFHDDVGDHFIYLYVSFMIFMTAIQIMNQSTYYNEVSSFLEVPSLKYIKSSLEESEKNTILENILSQMENEKYFKSSTASLSGLAKAIHETPHHVSQVINEKIGKSFFELLATYRVKEAQTILKTDMGKKLTIEEVAERVGYNSKSAFNSAFKKITSKTPSAFRDS
ncbi:helix-turn-helix domain-containing protein [Muricauda sp. 2012CJ35-5]|uniref:Helix-turn-helix domain-containing protein n=1 Tax=Flagellimonas spongiicola TaxID=2942208 RepID=A0ABT0PNV5_9FLAO|nr:helix-turn-helix domain-containing protein [Allomuricauda spongiicola]MCL6272636.1 helix-turn-helix domain-containing protein [Allomuricauda spongiicola]